LRSKRGQVTGDRGQWRCAAVLLLLCALASTARAEVYATEEQALKIVFPKATQVTREVKSLTPEQREKLQKDSHLHFPEREYTFLVTPQGRALVMNEVGKSEAITFMVGIGQDGKISDVVVMEFRESRGWEVKEKRFTSQFKGKKAKDPIRVNQDIMNYTGATLSSEAMARGVKRALLLNELFYGSGK
jgi:Na+-translocating ferredoxin:NAD+ oxidoreductase RnfG subunit